MNAFDDLEIWIKEASKPAVYPVAVTWSPAGPATGEMLLDLTAPEIQKLLRPVQSVQYDPDVRKVFGCVLFKQLFADAIGKAWFTSRGRVQGQPGRRLRLRLWIEAPELSVLPWELLHDGADFLGATDDVPMSRYLPVGEPAAFITPGKAKVLIVVQAPQVAGVEPIDPEVLAGLRKAIGEHSRRFASPKVLENATLAEINTELLSGYQVLHYIGHGAPNKLLIAADREVEIKDTREFAALFTGRPGLQLVLLNVCSSGATTDYGIFSGLGPVIAEKRIPAVIAMQYARVAQSTVAEFNTSFYAALGKDQPIDVSVNVARKALLLKHGGTRDWSTPVLYLTVRTANVLEFAADEADADHRARAAAEIASAQERILREMVVAVKQLSGGLRRLSGLTQVAKSAQTYRAMVDAVPSPLQLGSIQPWKFAQQQGWSVLANDVTRTVSFQDNPSWVELRNLVGQVDEDLPANNFGRAGTSFSNLLNALATFLNEIAVNINDEMSEATKIADTTLVRIKAD